MMPADSHMSVSREEIFEHLEAVIGSQAFSNSPKYVDLLRYLVESSLDEKTPHEIDIAIDVFGKDQSYDPSESSSIRVRVHQLRRKLDEYYRSVLPDGDSRVRFSVPKGNYRIDFGAERLAPDVRAPNRNGSAIRARTRWLVAVSVLLLGSVSVNMLMLAQLGGGAAGRSAILQPASGIAWESVAEGPEPILIALGDFFVFRDDSGEGRTRFIRDIAVNSPEDLRALPAQETLAQPADLTYLPKSTAFTLEAILPIVQSTGKAVSLKLMSEVTGEDLREHDVIYIGFIRSMGPLQDYFFRSSSFSSPPPFVELRDKRTGETFVSSGDLYGHTLDYGLFAKMAGPGDGEILLFTGIRDIGILHTVRALTEPGRARALAREIAWDIGQLRSPVEIFFEVSGYHRTDLQAKVIKASRPPEPESSRKL